MRLIDADEFMELFYTMAMEQDKSFVEAVEQVIADTSTVDAEPVKHGKWIWKERHFGSANEICTGRVYDNILGVTTLTGQVSRDSRYVENVPYCSLCGKRNDGIHLNYCDYCGAKMDLEE